MGAGLENLGHRDTAPPNGFPPRYMSTRSPYSGKLDIGKIFHYTFLYPPKSGRSPGGYDGLFAAAATSRSYVDRPNALSTTVSTAVGTDPIVSTAHATASSTGQP